MTNQTPDERVSDLQLVQIFCDLVDLDICDELCEYYPADAGAQCSDLLDSDTCDPCRVPGA